MHLRLGCCTQFARARSVHCTGPVRIPVAQLAAGPHSSFSVGTKSVLQAGGTELMVPAWTHAVLHTADTWNNNQPRLQPSQEGAGCRCRPSRTIEFMPAV